jgi:2-haloacid dehalogenase
MRYPWILFDADGTLFDYRTAEAAALSATLAELDVAPSPAHLAAYRRFNAELWGGLERGEITRDHLQSERFRKLSDEFSLDADPVDLNARYLDNLGRRADLVDGALRLLDAVHRSRGVILITNGFSRVQRSRLAVSGLSTSSTQS